MRLQTATSMRSSELSAACIWMSPAVLTFEHCLTNITTSNPLDSSLDMQSQDVLNRRKSLRDLRVQQLADDAFDPQVIRLAAEEDCHSDDEYDEQSQMFIVHKKEGRDVLVSHLFRMENERLVETQRRRGLRPGRNNRFEGPLPEQSTLAARIPSNVPIDYFSPEYFNSLTVRERARYMNNGVALPTAEHCRGLSDVLLWKNLSRSEFMAKFGNAKLALYRLPTEEELQRMEYTDLIYLDNDGPDAEEEEEVKISVVEG
ncbi:hypothetical protein MKEN_00487400 [Mycena kentingensis (nom. inval.)]|nr:hypothetical protein MKEN_00487400 [Mycena kentingensis (nom. inval.)]